VHVDFLRKLRSERRFESFDALKQQILCDAEQAREFFRRRFPLVYGGLDLAPLVILLIIVFLQRFVVTTLFELAIRVGMGT
jgi:uncharacterized protein YggT (Ycf19 family)